MGDTDIVRIKEPNKLIGAEQLAKDASPRAGMVDDPEAPAAGSDLLHGWRRAWWFIDGPTRPTTGSILLGGREVLFIPGRSPCKRIPIRLGTLGRRWPRRLARLLDDRRRGGGRCIGTNCAGLEYEEAS